VRICSIARLTKRAAPLINLSISQYLTNCAIFSQSRSALTLELGLGLGLGLWLGLVLELGLKLGFRLRLHNWQNVQRI